MVWVLTSSKTALSTTGALNLARSMDSENCASHRARFTVETGAMIPLAVREYSYGQMGGNTKATSFKISFMDMASTFGLMARATKVITKKTRKMGMEL